LLNFTVGRFELSPLITACAAAKFLKLQLFQKDFGIADKIRCNFTGNITDYSIFNFLAPQSR
jgi:hypothetical protein